MSPNLRFLRHRVGERIISACVIPTVKHGGGGVRVWWWFAGYTISDLFRIQGTLNQHGFHSILQRYAIQYDINLFFKMTMTQHTSRLCKWLFDQEGEWWSAESDDLASIITRPQPRWDGLGWVDRGVKKKQATSAQHMWELLQDCWKSIPGDNLMKLSERM